MTEFSVGHLLSTPHTKKWTQDQIRHGVKEESRRVFWGFTMTDQGRSRIAIATCQTSEQAFKLVKFLNRANVTPEELELF